MWAVLAIVGVTVDRVNDLSLINELIQPTVYSTIPGAQVGERKDTLINWMVFAISCGIYTPPQPGSTDKLTSQQELCEL